MESLKALHYPLDNPVVAFIAISNHHLDSAKENRMACLQRDKPTVDDLETLAQGNNAAKIGNTSRCAKGQFLPAKPLEG